MQRHTAAGWPCQRDSLTILDADDLPNSAGNPPGERMSTVTIVRDVACGKLAGAVGTAAMDALWYWRYRRRDGDDGFATWELAESVKDWSHAPAPAQFGRKVAEKAFHKKFPPEAARPITNAVHWGTGIGWGALYGMATRSGRARRPMLTALLFGTAVWATSYVVLPLAKVYKPIWEYEPEALWQDLSAHLVYGAATAATYRVLSR